jgi:hypothetical protein
MDLTHFESGFPTFGRLRIERIRMVLAVLIESGLAKVFRPSEGLEETTGRAANHVYESFRDRLMYKQL